MKVVIRHVAFEDLGSFAAALRRRSAEVRILDAGIDDLRELHSAVADVVVVLGGPIGAYEDRIYPFLRTELDVISRRIAANLPTIESQRSGPQAGSRNGRYVQSAPGRARIRQRLDGLLPTRGRPHGKWRSGRSSSVPYKSFGPGRKLSSARPSLSPCHDQARASPKAEWHSSKTEPAEYPRLRRRLLSSPAPRPWVCCDPCGPRVLRFPVLQGTFAAAGSSAK